MFEEWLALKFANYAMMDQITKKVLWDFWKKSNDQNGVIDDGFSDLEGANNDDEQEIDINQIVGRNSNTSLNSDVQEDEEHENDEEGYELFNDTTRKGPDLAGKKSTNVGEVSINLEFLLMRRVSRSNSLPSKTSGDFLVLIF
ncbi:hypothetical protein Tco_0217663 [Tanacetum coccineum]